jgi:hypothetical protein
MSQYYYVKCSGDGSFLKRAPANRGHEFTMDKSEALKLKRSEAANLGYAGDPIYRLIPCGNATLTLNDAITNARHALQDEQGYREHSDALIQLLDVVCTTVEENREPEKAPFGGIAFDPQRKADSNGVKEDTLTNNQKADIGKAVVALYYLLSQPESSYRKLQARLMVYASGVDLTQEPEYPIGGMLTDIMHYCHRDEIEFNIHSEHSPLPTAHRQFQVESGGASL